jgi:hypothetical protein
MQLIDRIGRGRDLTCPNKLTDANFASKGLFSVSGSQKTLGPMKFRTQS